MPPTDAGAGAEAGTEPLTAIGPYAGPGPDTSGTEAARGGTDSSGASDTSGTWGTSGSSRTGASETSDSEDTLDLQLPDELLALIKEERAEEHAEERAGAGWEGRTGTRSPRPVDGDRRTGRLSCDDLLDHVGEWGPIPTPAGAFHLVPVSVERDLPLVGAWMNDPAVAAFWELAGPPSATEEHLRAQLAGDGRSVPCLGLLDGTPMSYWEIYRADLDPLARHCPVRPHDTGIHLLIADAAGRGRGRGIGSTLLRAVADLVLGRRPACARVVAEPDLRNTPSVAAFLRAGFRFAAEVDLPAKRAALMIRDRSLRDLL